MMNKATLFGVLAGSITYWVLEGLWMGLLMPDFYTKVMEPYAAVLNAQESMSPAVWLVNTTAFSLILAWVLGRGGTVSGKDGAITGAVLGVLITLMFEWSFHNYFVGYSFVNTSLVSIGWEAVSCGITGFVVGTVMKRFA